jgi:hypothetical protein
MPAAKLTARLRRGGCASSAVATSMKAYVMTTGTVFGLLVVAHIWRVIEEGPGPAKEPLFLLVTLTAGALSLWAWRVLRLMSSNR